MFPLHDPINDDTRKELAAYDDLTAALLVRRGITTREAAEAFLNPSYDEHLHDPLSMTDMPRAARRFADAIVSGEKIAVWSDYDCDGIPGAVLLHDFLKKAGANFENYIPHRHHEGYGMNPTGLSALAKRGVTLVVTVDVGITDVAAVAHANELGMEVIVTDHHLPGETLPPAFAVVNPHARADEPYPFHELCGSGVAWKLIGATLATEPSLREKIPEGWEKWLLDMVGLATVADMVPLVGENRVLATYGLLVLRKSPRLGLQKLCRTIRVDQRTLTEDDLGFMVAPRVNAASRMGDAIDAFRLFTTEDESEADALAKKLEAANRKRKSESGAITRAVHTRLKEREELPAVIAMGDPDWRPSLLGLVAGTIADEFERPVLLWGREGNHAIKGSIRSGAVHALELMQAAEDTFEQCGGHAAAGGFTVKSDAVFDFEERLVAAYETLDTAKDDSYPERADATLALENATLPFLKEVSRLAPFGMENPKPVFLVTPVTVEAVSRFGKNSEHLKLRLRAPEAPRGIDAVTFFVKGHIARTVEGLSGGEVVRVLAHLERDTFSRGTPLRLRLLDVHIA